MGQTFQITFSHAIQKKYNYKGQLLEEKRLTSGNAIYGREKGQDFYYYSTGNYYELDLYFNLPNKLYEYNILGKSLNLINMSNHIDVHQYIKETTSSSEIFIEHTSTIDNTLVLTTKNSSLVPGKSFSTYCYFGNSEINSLQINNSSQVKLTWSSSTVEKDEYTGPYGEKYETRNSYIHTVKNIQNLYMELLAEDITINIAPIYPVNVYLKNNNSCVFTWDYSFSVSRTTMLYVNHWKLDIYNPQGTLLYTTQANNDQKYANINASVFSGVTGNCYYNLHIDTNYSTVSADSGYYGFILTGQTSAPDIVSISQNSFPTITWSCSNQIAWQMVIKNAYETLFDSGMVTGTEQSYKLDKFLEDGAYSIEMRALNKYGVYTGWNSKSFELNPSKPSKPSGIIISANNKFGVYAKCDDVDNGLLYVIRRHNPEEAPVIIGEYKNGFVDYSIPLNDTYEYALRHYSTGYSDSDWYDATVVSNGIVIRDSENREKFVNIWKTTEGIFDIVPSYERNDTLIQCIGREYPVEEIGEWLTSTRSFVGFVSNSDYEILKDLKTKSKNILFQNTKESIICHMSFKDSGTHMNDGRIIDFALTRIDGDVI